MNAPTITIRPPVADDATSIWRIVKDSGVLDPNSIYAYLLLVTDFADTCVVAEMGGRVVGFITGYRPPARPETLFVWQVGVAAPARRRGVASRMLDALREAPGARDATRLQTTVSPSNAASRGMFEAFASRHGATLSVGPGFDAELFGATGHETEELLTIAPLSPPTSSTAAPETSE